MRLDFALVIGVILLVDHAPSACVAYLNYGEPIGLRRSCLLVIHNTSATFSFLADAGGWHDGYFRLGYWCVPMRHGHYVILTYVEWCSRVCTLIPARLAMLLIEWH